MQCSPCDPRENGSGPSAQLLAYLDEFSAGDALEIISSLASGEELPGFESFAELLTDDTACTELVAALRELTTMPPDAAERWGTAVAEHLCSGHLRCLVGQARAQPERLDALRARLEAAQKNESEKKERMAAVSEHKKGLLSCRDGESAAIRSELQVAAAAERAAHRLERGRVSAETPEGAAEAVRGELGRMGCCVRGQAAFCYGFVGSANTFMFRQRRSGALAYLCMVHGICAPRALTIMRPQSMLRSSVMNARLSVKLIYTQETVVTRHDENSEHPYFTRAIPTVYSTVGSLHE